VLWPDCPAVVGVADAGPEAEADGVGWLAEGVVEADGALLAEGSDDGAVVAVELGAALLGDAVGEADFVAAPLGLVVGFRGSLTWVMVVPSPPERAWPETSSKAVRAAAAMANAARAPTTMLFQFGPRRAGGSGAAAAVAGMGASGWVGAHELVVGWVPLRTSMLVGSVLLASLLDGWALGHPVLAGAAP
jgi:hypothetical protein